MNHNSKEQENIIENVNINKEGINPFLERIERENEKIGFWIGFFEGICLFAIIFQIYIMIKLFKVNYICWAIVLILMIIELFIMMGIYKILRSKER